MTGVSARVGCERCGRKLRAVGGATHDLNIEKSSIGASTIRDLKNRRGLQEGLSPAEKTMHIASLKGLFVHREGGWGGCLSGAIKSKNRQALWGVSP